MKEWLVELLVDTIVAAVVTLLFYIIRLDHSWDDAMRTYAMSFAIMLALGIYRKTKRNKE